MPSRRTLDRQALLERARELGFARAGIARAVPLEREGERLRAWLAEERHGSMDWMERTSEVRIDPRAPGMLPSALSVIVLVAPYARAEESIGPAPGVVARYARGRDYHNVLRKRCGKLVEALREAGHAARAGVDSLPIFERAWAERAGVGFIGKNACLIVPGLGSHVFLACIVTSAGFEPDTPMRERCGSCTRCLDACPTEAFVGARELDARRCISYLTIEHRGDIAPSLMERMGSWFLGCDVCQDICPFNRTSLPDAATTSPFAPDRRWNHDSETLLSMSESEFDAWSLGSPVRRLGLSNAARNAAIVMGNAGSKRHLPVLERAANDHSDASVRNAARWAGERLQNREQAATSSETAHGPTEKKPS